MLNIRLIGAMIGALAGAVAIAAVVKGFDHYRHVSAEAAAYAECKAAANGVRKSAAALKSHCDEAIANAVLTAASAEACDVSLSQADTFGQRQTCSAAVKTLIAERDARADEVKNRDAELATLRAGQDAAIARARALGEDLSRRRADAERALSTAPVGANGRRSCDAVCLRALAGG